MSGGDTVSRMDNVRENAAKFTATIEAQEGTLRVSHAAWQEEEIVIAKRLQASLAAACQVMIVVRKRGVPVMNFREPSSVLSLLWPLAFGKALRGTYSGPRIT